MERILSDREVTKSLFIKRIKNKQHKDLRQDPRYRSKKEKTLKERRRVLEEVEAETEIKEFLK